MSTFVKYLGHSKLNGMSVVVSKDGDKYILKAETIGFKPLTFTYRDENGVRRITSVPKMTLSEAQFEAFENEVTRGIYSPSDAVIVYRALIKMGYPEEFFE
ncbi:hypothetical protein FIX32_21510 [Salmonella enterica]|nr:hypothetical protein [Salmonella enterica]